ncbi:MAG: signal recognition particle-docking protein FtsY [Christensenellaceae bacterium]|jgi:fused signal recognition particle receptor|nr:signal recognition particle-docking protein FtsY [Christensenellaceae bacterium]
MAGFFEKLKGGLSQTGGGLLAGLFAGDARIDGDFYDELEEALILADVGMPTSTKILGQLKETVRAQNIHTSGEAKQAMVELLTGIMRPEESFLPQAGQAVLLIVGVNGVGKTTSIGKLAHYYKQQGQKPLLAAADTFRAAAAEQLRIWAGRADVPIVSQGEGADPAAVVFDAIASYKAKGLNLLLVDTAGRLHNKKNLMAELSKMRRIVERELPEVRCETLLVLDAVTGQNALAQAKAFGEAAGLTGIILTKLDGTAKGGVALAVREELGVPVRFVGVGEGIDDLQPFDPEAFARALLG